MQTTILLLWMLGPMVSHSFFLTLTIYKPFVIQLGSQSDGGVLYNSLIGEKLSTDEFDFPPAKLLPGTNQLFHPYFVGDSAFPLTHNIIRPFVAPLQELTDRQLYFNYRVGRGRISVENLFGVLVARWGVYHRTIPCRPKTVDKIVKATVVLHNFIKKRKGDSVRYQPEGYVDWVDENDQVISGSWRKEIPSDILHPIEFDMAPGGS